ncbi:MAG: nucleotide exchange factor GrpE [Clostridiales bacterium]|jgi:molecular chaperone GrpE|nr:nucleotide exchange factor GrpE [Clostridiales bacterium]
MKKNKPRNAEVKETAAAEEKAEENSLCPDQETAETVEIIDEAPPHAADESERRYEELMDRLQRTMADFDNFRKRSIKEKASMYDEGVRDTVERLLPVVDNFQRALASRVPGAAGFCPVEGPGASPGPSAGLEAENGGERDTAFYKGVEMLLRQLCKVLDDLGVKVIPAAGERFDPSLHHAVAHVEDETLGANVVAEELQKGYIYKERVVRPSMVKVAN